MCRKTLILIITIAILFFRQTLTSISIRQGENVTLSAKGSIALNPGKGILSLNGDVRVASDLFVQNQNLLSIIQNQDSIIQNQQTVIEQLKERLEQYQFQISSNWHVFDVGVAVHTRARGYTDAAFDGRYIYFSPYRDNYGAHGIVLRYDTQASFFSASSWSVFDATTVNTYAQGYVGALYHDHYVYFAPYLIPLVSSNGNVLRYDTRLGFTNTTSWSVFPAQSLNGYGFYGAVTDNIFIYFIPYTNGVFVRYDTRLPFESTTSWTTFDISAVAPGNTIYARGAYDNTRYLYFFPTTLISQHAYTVLRYDTQQDFNATSAWTTYPIGRQFAGGVLEGDYLYLAPYYDGTNFNGVAVRYDTRTPFNESTSWSSYDAGYTEGMRVAGLTGAVSDGRYIYYAPLVETTNQYHGRALRYDTRGSFTSESSWSAFDAGAALNARGYHGLIRVGQYIYYCPYSDYPNNFHGKVLRYKTQVLT